MQGLPGYTLGDSSSISNPVANKLSTNWFKFFCGTTSATGLLLVAEENDCIKPSQQVLFSPGDRDVNYLLLLFTERSNCHAVTCCSLCLSLRVVHSPEYLCYHLCPGLSFQQVFHEISVKAVSVSLFSFRCIGHSVNRSGSEEADTDIKELSGLATRD